MPNVDELPSVRGIIGHTSIGDQLTRSLNVRGHGWKIHVTVFYSFYNDAFTARQGFFYLGKQTLGLIIKPSSVLSLQRKYQIITARPRLA